jgi:hypothetical protein
MNDHNPSGSAYGLGNDVNSIVPARRKEYEYSKDEADQLRRALDEPKRKVTPDDVRVDSAIAAIIADPILTPAQQHAKRLGWIPQPDGSLKHVTQMAAEAEDDGYSDAEYRALVAELDEDDEDEPDEGPVFAWR